MRALKEEWAGLGESTKRGVGWHYRSGWTAHKLLMKKAMVSHVHIHDM